MSVGIQEVIIICVPEGMRYNKMRHWEENKCCEWDKREKKTSSVGEKTSTRQTQIYYLKQTQQFVPEL